MFLGTNTNSYILTGEKLESRFDELYEGWAKKNVYGKAFEYSTFSGKLFNMEQTVHSEILDEEALLNLKAQVKNEVLNELENVRIDSEDELVNEFEQVANSNLFWFIETWKDEKIEAFEMGENER